MTKLLTAFTTAFMLFNAILLQAQTTWTVDNTPGSSAQFSDIQSAINAASDGDTILVQHSITSYTGTNNSNIEINKNLTIIGASHFDQNYITTLGRVVLTNGSSGTTLRGLYIAGGGVDTEVDPNIPNAVISNIRIQDCRLNGSTFGSNNSGIPYTVTNVIIEGCDTGGLTFASFATNCIVRNNLMSSISVSDADQVVISNNIFFIQSFGNQILNNDPTDTLNLFNNVFFSPSPNVNQIGISGSYQLTNCLLFALGSSSSMTISDNNPPVGNVINSIFNQNPLFVNPATYVNAASQQNNIPDFSVPANSPLIAAGVNGGDIGFQSNFVFKYLGNPKGYPEVKVTNYTGATQPNGTLTFEIDATSH